jgi:hypothetical protein
MRIGHFSLLIPEGREGGSGHVSLQHGQTYTLRLGNHSHLRCDAEITIDGKPGGGFRVGSNQTITLERPQNDTGRFTFLLRDSADGSAAELAGVSQSDLGLVQVRFRPERYTPPQHILGVGHLRTIGAGRQSMGGAHSTGGATRGFDDGITTSDCDFAAAAPGGTGLTGHSGQTFYTVTNLDYDLAAEVVITLRLVSSNEAAVRPLAAVRQENPIPPPVG